MVLLSDSNPFDSANTQIQYKKEDFSKFHALCAERTGEELTEKALISIGFMNADGFLSKGAVFFKDDCTDERTKIVGTV